ncbi:RHS repeat-associated core domain-containing protein [Fibrobacter sp. UWB10]|nr:RHS repeat-associated core domain-containing protein [Fibrobacter sp. UWB10]
MGAFIKKIIQIALFSACISVALADTCPAADEQICPPRLDPDSRILYGLPGWENIKYPALYGVLTEDDSVLHVDLRANIKFGGTTYSEVTVTNKGRVYLGHLPNDFDYSDGARGYTPFLETTKKKIRPLSGSSSIGVVWQTINSLETYSVIEIGPFNIDDFEYPVLFQVILYMNGEIQFQPWVKWGDAAAYAYNGQYYSSLLNKLVGKDLFYPRLYNGGHDVIADYNAMISSKKEPLVFDGQLRPGWVAKSFNNMGVSFSPGENGINVYFGSEKAAGGLFAYDHSRERPVVGSFNYVTVEAYSISYGFNLNAESAVPVFFWYFGKDNGDWISEAHAANYPYFVDGFQLKQTMPIYAKKDLLSVSNRLRLRGGDLLPYSWKFTTAHDYSVIWPIAYMDSWNVADSAVQDIDMTRAVAFKFQTWDDAKDRAISIKNVMYGLRQPRSVQFLPPKTHVLTFVSDGLSYIKGSNFSGGLPLEFIEGASLYAKIIPSPGDTIEEVVINGATVYKRDSVLWSNFVSVSGDGSIDLTLEHSSSDLNVVASSKKCGTRALHAVNPSYVKTEVFLDPLKTSRKLETYAVKDGLGRVVQTQTNLGNGYYNVSATYLDDFGNVEFAPLSYLSAKDSFAYEDMYCKMCIVKSSNYYNGTDNLDRQLAFGIPYAKEDYHYGEGNGVTKDISGVAEASYAMSQKSSMQWTIPIETSDYTNFISEEQLNENVLTGKYASAKNAIVDEKSSVENWTDYGFKLVVNRSAEGVYTQQIFDANGNVLYTWAKSGEHEVISRSHYNSDNQIDSTDISVDRGPFILATVYTYDMVGRVKTLTTPDKGTVVSMYDAEDRVRFTRDARQQAMSEKLGCSGNYFSTIEYDDRGKVAKTGEVHCGHSFNDSATSVPDDKLYILSENFYGKPTIGDLLSTHVTTDSKLLQGILDEMEGVSPNDVGAVASYDGSRVRSEAAIRANSLKMSSYNRLGQKIKQWTIYGLEGAPATQASFTYNISGELSSTETAEWKNGSWNKISTLVYSYDGMGRLKSVLEDGDSLMRIDRTDAGTVSKKRYFDKGAPVYDMTYAKDIYGRTTRVEYKNSSGKTLYSETATYPSAVVGRIDSAHHVWDGYHSNENYTYDAQGRLTGYESDNNHVGGGRYSYDGLGRLEFKREGRFGNDTLISYTYSNAFFRPLTMRVKGGPETEYYAYDESGNVWLDRNSMSAYTINALGLPSKVHLFSKIPGTLTSDQLARDEWVESRSATTEMAYDEGGQRIWTKFVANAPSHTTEVTYPGIGEYKYSGRNYSNDLELARIDLLGGGYRTGLNGEAVFPVKDLQGSVRGYVNKSGLKSAFGYRPYGTTIDLARYASDDDRRWQGKEYDGEHDKLYFGARFYDPFFGLWMSPDPAGQFANPYSYGGDPLNYIDPTGMWALGAGLVFGYDESHGWSLGVGVAAEFEDSGVNASYTFNQDGSRSLGLNTNASVCVDGVCFNGGSGFNMNTYTGTSVSKSAGICFGSSSDACAGYELGQGYSWDRSGGFVGMTVYAEVYAAFAGGRSSYGYEQGFFGAEGRGMYAGISGYGLHAEVSQNGGTSWGFEERLYSGIGNNSSSLAADGTTASMVKWELWMPSLGRFGHFTFGDGYDVSNDGLGKALADEVVPLLKSSSNEDDWKLAEKIRNNPNNLTYAEFLKLDQFLLANGFEHVKRMNNHPDGFKKVTYRKAGSTLYGNLELMYSKGENRAYSSYNYGNNHISHMLIDLFGWKGRGY